MYAVKYRGRLCFISPKSRSSLVKLIEVFAAWTDIRHRDCSAFSLLTADSASLSDDQWRT
jgi:hypothetical protein